MQSTSELTLESATDYFKLFWKVNEPLTHYFSTGNARICVGHNDVAYGHKIAGVEGFARFLWGAGPADNRLDKDIISRIVEGVLHGTDPLDAEYWGNIGNADQRMVEMPAIAFALIHHDHLLWRHFSKPEQDQIFKWFNQINKYDAPDGNWQFFRVIVNLIFDQLGYKLNTEKQIESITKIERCYRSNGWYQDSSRGREDYYTAFAFHYYGLLYSFLAPDDPQSHVFRQRAAAFAHQFIHFFADEGANVPFGRSMIYRYAAVAFWSAVVFAKLDGIDMGVVKGIINRNLRWWFKRPILSDAGLLSLGYTYPQLSMTEPYNSNQSPYWSNKIFLLLALSDDDPYWQLKEKPLPKLANELVLTEPKMIVSHDKGHTQLLNAGQEGPNYHTLSNEKYLKFAYSSYFGFSIPRSDESPADQAMDSMLGIQMSRFQSFTSIDRKNIEIVNQFYVRNRVDNIQTGTAYVASTWNLATNINCRTWLTSIDGWQIRIHRLEVPEAMTIYETGYALPWSPDYEDTRVMTKQYAIDKFGFSGIIDLLPKQEFERTPNNVRAMPNTNLMTSSTTFIPGLINELKRGTYWLATGIYAHFNTSYAINKWQLQPEVSINQDQIQVSLKSIHICIPLTN